MPAGIGLGAIAGLARDVRAADDVPDPIAVVGPGAPEVAHALAEGGPAELVQVGHDPADACALVCLVDTALGDAERSALRKASTHGRPVVAVRRDGTELAVPYVLAMDVVAWAPGSPLPVDAIASRLAVRLQRSGRLLAAHLPAMRAPVTRVISSTTAVRGVALTVLPFGGDVLMPVLSFMQARMLLDLKAADDGAPPTTPDQVALALGPRLGLPYAAGLAARTAYRALPPQLQRVASPVLAYGVTRALAAASPRFPF